MNKLKLIFITETMNSGGGTERVLVNLANSLHEKGHEVIILATTIGHENIYELNKAITLRQFRYGNFKNRFKHYFLTRLIHKLIGHYFLQSFLSKYTDQNTKSIVSFSAGKTIDCIKTKYRNKLISFEHWPFWAYDNYPKVQKKIRKNYPGLKKIVVLTKHEKGIYEEMGCNVIKIPNAYSFFSESTATLNNKTVLSIGHFNTAKRRDLLIKAWHYVSRKHPDWELVIVGDGNEKDNCIKLINDLNLTKTIRIIAPTKNIIDQYLNSSIFVLSSELETLPMVLIEAKATGLPCVSFDIICGPNEIIKDSEDGFLVPFADTTKMSEKICTLIEDISLRKKFGHAGRMDAQERYNPEKIYTTWIDFLSNC